MGLETTAAPFKVGTQDFGYDEASSERFELKVISLWSFGLIIVVTVMVYFVVHCPVFFKIVACRANVVFAAATSFTFAWMKTHDKVSCGEGMRSPSGPFNTCNASLISVPHIRTNGHCVETMSHKT